MAANRFMAYLEQCHRVTRGRGRVTWGIDLEKWDPEIPDAKQPDDLWLATWAEHGITGEVIFARALDGKEALRRLLLLLVARYGPVPAPVKRTN